MAQVMRDAYTRLTEHGYAPAYPEASPRQGDDQQGPRARYGVSLAGLIAADLLDILARRHP